MKVQRIAVTLVAVAVFGLAACSSTSKNNAAGSTTSVVDTTVAETSSPTTAAPPAATTPATAAPATPAPTTPAPPTRNLYDQVDGPSVPSGRTDPFVSSGVLADGVYWVRYNGGETLTPDITVFQAFFGQECIDQATAVGDECLNDIFVPDPPSRDIADLPFANDVFLTVAAEDTQLSYWITPDELRTIRSGSPSVADAPGGIFVPFAFLMTVQGGAITKFEQVWTP